MLVYMSDCVEWNEERERHKNKSLSLSNTDTPTHLQSAYNVRQQNPRFPNSLFLSHFICFLPTRPLKHFFLRVVFFPRIQYVFFPFGAHDRKTGYDKTIISWFNLLFGASIGKDNLNPFLILSYPPFVIFILSFWWVRIILS